MPPTQPSSTPARQPTFSAPLILSGVPGSPYTRKMLALLRYRRIPYRLLQTARTPEGMPAPKVPLLPTFYLPDAQGAVEAVTDSTPLLRRFEREFKDRHAVPSDPALALVDALIEDYADEWLTKAMFHYRWAHPADYHKAEKILPCWSSEPLDDARHAEYGRWVSTRQHSRLRYVGSNPTTAEVIESSYERFLDAFEEHLRHYPFLLGGRPGAGDFAVYGQLTQLTQFDPTPMAIAVQRAPRVYAWVTLMEDHCGLEPLESDWCSSTALAHGEIPSLRTLLHEIGRVYPALLLENAAALQRGAPQLETEIDGKPWIQNTFPYQGKCLLWLRRDYEALNDQDRLRADQMLRGTGCEAIFAHASSCRSS